MIKAIVFVGWVGVALLLVAAVTGYRIADETDTQQHLTLALFPTGALFFADLCLLIYLPLTLRVIRRTAAELTLPPHWLAEHRRMVIATAIWPLAGAATLIALFGSGYPVFVQTWPRWVHHALFAAAGVLHVVTLLLAGRALRDGEARLAAFGAAAEASAGSYTPPPPARPAPTSHEQ
jgi:cytochrome c biogenesis protein CcdA